MKSGRNLQDILKSLKILLVIFTNWSISYNTMKGFAQISWFNLILLKWKLQLVYVKGKKILFFTSNLTLLVDIACWYWVLISRIKIKTKIVPETWIFFENFFRARKKFLIVQFSYIGTMWQIFYSYTLCMKLYEKVFLQGIVWQSLIVYSPGFWLKSIF